MVKKSFRYKVMFIFLVPSIAMAYFVIYFLSLKYESLQKSEIFLTASKNIKITSKLIHSLQLERGWSSGYIVKATPQIRKSLLQRQASTRKIFEQFLEQLNQKTELSEDLDKSVLYKNKDILKEFLTLHHRIKDIRERVLEANITFDEEVQYYTNLNKKLLELIQIYLLNYNGNFEKSILMLENFKELAGQERAYLYNYILAQDFSHKEKVLKLIFEQKRYQKEFLLYSTIDSIALYNKTVDIAIQRKIESFRKRFFDGKLKPENAQEWFSIATTRINQYEKVSMRLLNVFEKKFEDKYNQESFSLVVAFILMLFSVTSIVFLLYYLVKLIDKEEQLLEDLRISSYTFDSQEAVTITDPNGKILKVNNAFTEITGYSREEAIGKNPSILKSGVHSEEFYKKMWEELHTKGKWSGEVYNKKKSGEIYPEKLSITAIKDEEGITTHYIAQFIDISDLKKAQEKAIYQASHDFLTKLPNRKSMMEKLKEELLRAKHHHYQGAFLFLDLDRFKKINDNYGHNIGDKALIEIAKRLKESLDEDDFLARISGDEFCIIIPNLDSDTQKAAQLVKAKCEKIIENIQKTLVINGYKLSLGISIGIKFFPDGEKDVDEIISSADAAMYKAKENGKNQYVFFNKEIEQKIKELSLLEKEIKEAFEENQFEFYFQPKVDLQQEAVIGAELLVRWNHPTRGLLPPGAFIDTVKEIGKISEITFMALQEACNFLITHQDKISGTLSINVSSLELISDTFLDDVVAIIEKCGVDAKHLEFEILENDLIDSFEVITENIAKLKALGMKISIDDFGTGYSSISYLRKLPVDTLKVDRYFVKNIDDSANRKLVEMIFEIAKSFEFEVIVEGVETQQQLEVIQENGAKYYQGYFFSKPIAQEEFEDLL